MLADFHPAATTTSLQAFAEADLRDTLADVDVPTLLLYGELDVRSPREVWEPIHKGIPALQARGRFWGRHMLDMQAPERCNAEIRAFVQQVESPALPAVADTEGGPCGSNDPEESGRPARGERHGAPLSTPGRPVVMVRAKAFTRRRSGRSSRCWGAIGSFSVRARTSRHEPRARLGRCRSTREPAGRGPSRA